MAALLMTDLSLVSSGDGFRTVRGDSSLVDEDEFRAANSEDDEVLGALALLDHPGAEVTIGGGAAAWVELRRPCERCAHASHVDGVCAACPGRCVECPRCGCPAGPFCASHDPGETVTLSHDAIVAIRATRAEAA